MVSADGTWPSAISPGAGVAPPDPAPPPEPPPPPPSSSPEHARALVPPTVSSPAAAPDRTRKWRLVQRSGMASFSCRRPTILPRHLRGPACRRPLGDLGGVGDHVVAGDRRRPGRRIPRTERVDLLGRDRRLERE